MKKTVIKCTLSFFVKEYSPYIKHPKWFEFWKKSIMIDNWKWVRKTANVEALNDEEAY